MSYPFYYLDVFLNGKMYRLFRLTDAFFLQRQTKDNCDSTLIPHIEDKTKKDFVICFREIKDILIEGDVHYDEDGERTEYFFGDVTLRMRDQSYKKMDIVSDISEEDLRTFFEEVSFTVRKQKPQTYEKPNFTQAQEEYEYKMRTKRDSKVQKALNIYFYIMIAYFVIGVFLKHDIMIYISAALFLINFTAVMALPQYFTIRPNKKNEQSRTTISAGIFLLLPLCYNALEMVTKPANVDGWITAWLVVSVVFTLILLVRYFGEIKCNLSSVLTVLLYSLLISYGITATLAVPTAKNNLISSKTGEAVDFERHSGKNSSYEITLLLDDGTQEEYYVTSTLYKNTEKGDILKVDTYEGVFGITFTYISN